jgi:hypothetical protein
MSQRKSEHPHELATFCCEGERERSRLAPGQKEHVPGSGTVDRRTCILTGGVPRLDCKVRSGTVRPAPRHDSIPPRRGRRRRRRPTQPGAHSAPQRHGVGPIHRDFRTRRLTSTPFRTRHIILIAALLLAALFLPALALQTARAAGTADLAITMVPSKKHLRYQQSMTNTITVTNLGPDTATGVTIATGESDSINPGSLVCADGTEVPNWEICPTITLAPGQSATYTWTVTACCTCCPDRVGITTASVRHDEATLDPNPDNDFAQVETRFTGRFPT